MQHWNSKNIFPLNFAFDGRFFINIGSYQIADFTFWIVGLLHHTQVQVISKVKAAPSGLALREIVTNTKANLYYTEYSQSSYSYDLIKEETNLQFITSNTVSVNIGQNCGTNIVVNPDIIVVACPGTSSSTNGLISIYKESNVSFIHTQSYTSSSFLIGNRISIVTSQNYVSYSF